MGADNRKFDGQSIFAATVIAVGIALYWLMFFDVGYQSGRNDERAHIERQHYASDAAENMDRTCSGLSGAALRECARNIVNSERESEREESDLAAQWNAADWARWATVVAGAQLIATIFGLYFIKGTLDATWKAVEDTGDATRAMHRQNELTEAAQRPWIRLSAQPKLVQRYGVDGLYLRVDFLAENIGKSPATHFDIEEAILFRAQAEDGAAFDARIKSKIAEWKGDYTTGPKAILAPNDTQVGSVWDDYVVPWWDMGIGTKTAHPVLLVAVLYRIPSAPERVQLSWRTWYLTCLSEDGTVLSFIPFPEEDLGPDKLCVEPMLASMAHEEYESEEQPERRMGKAKMRTVRLPPTDEA